jgi:DivIVA domain-containing protein
MALTPEDVVNKRFQATKFREGYDQDEVDDFLDEVVVELRRLNGENDELRQRLAAAEARAADAAKGAAAAPAPAAVYTEPAAPPPTVGRAHAGAAARSPTSTSRPPRRTCCSSPAASTRSTCARASRSATR